MRPSGRPGRRTRSPLRGAHRAAGERPAELLGGARAPQPGARRPRPPQSGRPSRAPGGRTSGTRAAWSAAVSASGPAQAPQRAGCGTAVAGEPAARSRHVASAPAPGRARGRHAHGVVGLARASEPRAAWVRSGLSPARRPRRAPAPAASRRGRSDLAGPPGAQQVLGLDAAGEAPDQHRARPRPPRARAAPRGRGG